MMNNLLGMCRLKKYIYMAFRMYCSFFIFIYLSRRASHDIRPSPIAGHCKRSSLDDTNSKSILGNSPPDQEGYRASSLPRGAKIACTGNSSLEDSGTTSAPKEKPMVEKKAEAVTKSEESGEFIGTELSAKSTGNVGC